MADDYYARLARARQGAGALITAPDGRVLMVDTSYRDFLEVPGGAVEAGEAAPDACARECAEELRCEVAVGRLLVIDHQNDGGELGDSLMFVYDGGVLAPDHLPARVPDAEVRALVYVDPVDLDSVTIPRLANRVRHAIEARRGSVVRELVHGRPR